MVGQNLVRTRWWEEQLHYVDWMLGQAVEVGKQRDWKQQLALQPSQEPLAHGTWANGAAECQDEIQVHHEEGSDHLLSPKLPDGSKSDISGKPENRNVKRCMHTVSIKVWVCWCSKTVWLVHAVTYAMGQGNLATTAKCSCSCRRHRDSACGCCEQLNNRAPTHFLLHKFLVPQIHHCYCYATLPPCRIYYFSTDSVCTRLVGYHLKVFSSCICNYWPRSNILYIMFRCVSESSPIVQNFTCPTPVVH